ncbi:MAG: 30S ribosome-binding factor RbfA [Christensenellales bacterium]|jgi:ribosome-binding factor A
MANIDRVNSQIQKELYTLINYELNDPRITDTLTITKVDTTRDLKYCKVFISKPSSDDEGVLSALQNSAGFLRKQLFAKLRIRTVPELKFVIDDSLDYAFRINEILSKLDIAKDDK